MVNLLWQTSVLTPWKLYMLLTTRIIYLIEGAERVDFVTAWGSDLKLVYHSSDRQLSIVGGRLTL